MPKIARKPPATRGEAWNGVSLRKNQHLDVRLPGSRATRKDISVAYFLVLCYDRSRNLIYEI